MKSPVCFSYGSRLEKKTIRLIWHHGFVSWQLNHAINVDMCNMDFLQGMQLMHELRGLRCGLIQCVCEAIVMDTNASLRTLFVHATAAEFSASQYLLLDASFAWCMWKDKQVSCICSLPAAETPLLEIVPGSAAQTWVLTAGRTWPLPSALQLLLSTAKATLLHAGNQGTHKAQKLIASMRCGMNCVMSTTSIKLYALYMASIGH